MQLDSMKPAPGSRKKRRRIGRGPGSGHGKTAGRGHKGQGSRAGGNVAPGFEGGQMPLSRRLPKRGFKNPFRVAYQVIGLGDLAEFDAGTVVDVEALRTRGLAKRGLPVKVLANGELSHGLTVKLDAFSKPARAAIESAGGSVELVTGATKKTRSTSNSDTEAVSPSEAGE
ncbi:MAG: 50S ribosomal protein L15 [Proteobacteria bacterium]|nr:50S ribosomal protein L15 [Pseudomonadota bacterium]